MRPLIVASLIAAASPPAHAQSLQIRGRFGYLGEYELSGEVAVNASTKEKQFAGPVAIRHVGICTHDGPDQTNGQINLSGGESQMTVTFLFDGRRCTYNGIMSEANVGELVCPGDTLPFSIWFK